MRRLIALFLFIFFSSILVISSSEKGMHWITQGRYARNDAWGADKYRFGDLYGVSYLSDFRIAKDTHLLPLPQKTDTVLRDYDLTILGDSYLYSSFQEHPAYFSRVKMLQFYRWSDSQQHLIFAKSNRKQVLLIECVERNMWDRMNLADARLRLDVQQEKSLPVDKSTKQILIDQLDRFDAGVKKAMYHPTLESNLDFVLFNLGFLGWIKERKADFTWKILGRTNPDVQVSRDGKFLYLEETLNAQKRGSSFRFVGKEDVDLMVHHLQEIESYYLSNGFDEVIFSLIPNPVAVLETEGKASNLAIQKIVEHPQLHVKMVDPSASLKQHALLNFYSSDSHWNLRGAQIWLNDFNQVLSKLP
ncbi:hypothetical protein EWU23_10060 [Cytophagaceae bacterium 50C-KIRBA]|uniref:AlgX/AlgJ SGNH hydrolase-like domain-containing protein n=1 Tax=Aquirufa beregesia TaxID=2516556 RepID=A0ABX0F4M6_9BACT|nr:hypothetical protein [Aquirufa beregesia]NGZ44820.1 hypothetical protein [Aquirufa beregesia]